MQIIQLNHKTVANLLKKSVEEHWLEDKDAYIRFTDGSTVCIHVLNPKWETYVSLNERTEKESTTNGVSFTDEQSIYWFYREDSDGALITDRIVSLDFDHARYYYHRQFDYVTRKYIPVVEFHYYEEGEKVARNDS